MYRRIIDWSNRTEWQMAAVNFIGEYCIIMLSYKFRAFTVHFGFGPLAGAPFDYYGATPYLRR